MAKILGHIGLFLGLSFSIYFLGYRVQQSEFWPILLYVSLAFAAYALVLKTAQSEALIHWYLIGGIGLRVLLLLATPQLSDDVYRYLWDGKLWLQGINPFIETPRYYLQHPPLPSGLSEPLFLQLNSPDYHSVYPPLAQGLFVLACAIYPDDWASSIMVLKLGLLLAEIGSLYFMSQLLQDLHYPRQNLLIYALNPLIIIEIMGNAHLEGLMICFLLAALYAWNRGQTAWGIFAFGASIAAKLLPLLFLPLLIRRWGWPQTSKKQLLGLAIVLLVFFVPVLNWAFIRGFASSLDLYFQRFEFNASIYYLLRGLFQALTGYNLIIALGPLLSLSTLYLILRMTKSEKAPSWPSLSTLMLYSFVIYLLNATTVHPWYLAVPVALCGLTQLKFPILWSGLAFLSYSHYQDGLFQENYLLIGLEYSGLAGMIYLERQKICGGH